MSCNLKIGKAMGKLGRMSPKHNILWFAIFLIGSGCGKPQAKLDAPDDFFDTDKPSVPPPAPQIETLPDPVPFRLVTLRGFAQNATKVRVELVNSANPLVVPVQAKGEFCADIFLPSEERTTFRFRSLNSSGQLSTDYAEAATAFNAQAPHINSTTCKNLSPYTCTSLFEDCEQPGDEDCNGYADDNDARCITATCSTDKYDPNGPRSPASASVASTDEDQLTTCSPQVPDWYKVNLQTNQRIIVEMDSLSGTNMHLAIWDLPDGSEVATDNGNDRLHVEYPGVDENGQVIGVTGPTVVYIQVRLDASESEILESPYKMYIRTQYALTDPGDPVDPPIPPKPEP